MNRTFSHRSNTKDFSLRSWNLNGTVSLTQSCSRFSSSCSRAIFVVIFPAEFSSTPSCYPTMLIQPTVLQMQRLTQIAVENQSMPKGILHNPPPTTVEKHYWQEFSRKMFNNSSQHHEAQKKLCQSVSINKKIHFVLKNIKCFLSIAFRHPLERTLSILIYQLPARHRQT